MSKKNRSRQDKTQTVKQRKNKERDKLAKQICNKKGKTFVQSVIQSNRKGLRKRSIRLFCLVCHSGEYWCVKVIGICLALCITFTEAEACCCRECRLKLTKTKGQLMIHYFSPQCFYHCFLDQLLSGQEFTVMQPNWKVRLFHRSSELFLPSWNVDLSYLSFRAKNKLGTGDMQFILHARRSTKSPNICAF